MNDLKKVYDAIEAKRKVYDVLSAYFNGQQPTPYLTKRMREVFAGVDTNFVENWCSVAISACDERINLTGFEASEEGAENALKDAWERSSIALEAADIHTDAQVLGECYAIVWPDDENKAAVFYNDPRMVHIVYAADNPRKVSMAGKMWKDDDGKAKLTLYYPDRLEYYTSGTTNYKDVSSAASFTPDDSVYAEGKAPNPYNKVPVFQFKINRHCTSDLINVLPLQNGVNKLLADMMVAAEYGAFSQRWVISAGDTAGLKNAPGEVWDLPAGDGAGQDTSTGQFESTDLKNYLDAIDRLSMAIGVITRTPKHYFYSQGGDPSGEALIALESPLNKKAQDRIDRFRPVWRDVALFICQIEGIAVDPTKVTPQFEKPETVQPMTQATIIKTNVDSTIPLETALTRAGWSDSEIEAMTKIKDEAAGKAQASLSKALMDAERAQKETPMPQNGNGNQPNNPMMVNGANNG